MTASHVVQHVRDLLQSLVALSQVHDYHDVSLYCNDGVERLNRLVVMLILPDLAAASHLMQDKVEIAVLLPDFSSAQIRELRKSFFSSLDCSLGPPTAAPASLKGIVECLDLTPNQLVYFQPSAVDRIISEEFIIHNADLNDSCREEDFNKLGDVSPPLDLSCQYCSKTFSRKFTLQRHVECQHEGASVVCGVCQKSVRKDNYSAHMGLHADRKFRCETCEKRFSRRAELNRHRRKHTADGLFTCKVCNKGFLNRTSFSYHIRTHNVEDRRFTCRECLKPFVTRTKLKQHLRCHTGEKTVKCTICSSQFSRMDNFKHHLRKMHQVQLPDLRLSK